MCGARVRRTQPPRASTHPVLMFEWKRKRKRKGRRERNTWVFPVPNRIGRVDARAGAEEYGEDALCMGSDPARCIPS
jgi:hypothetical protein